MQEVMKDGSEGKMFVEDTIEALIPHIKKSLSDPKVACVKVYKAKNLITGIPESDTKKESFLAEEEKVDTGKDLIESLKEGEGKDPLRDSFPPKKDKGKGSP